MARRSQTHQLLSVALDATVVRADKPAAFGPVEPVLPSELLPLERERELCRGPARLTRTLGLTGEHDGTDLLHPGSRVRLLAGAPVDPARVRTGPRVGVGGAGATTPWRFWLDGEPTMSAYRPAVPRTRRRPAS